MAQPRKHDYSLIIRLIREDPDRTFASIATQVGCSYCTVADIASKNGLSLGWKGAAYKRSVNGTGHTVGKVKRTSFKSDLEFEWETILHKAGLGMSRGASIGSFPILYGQDYARSSPNVP